MDQNLIILGVSVTTSEGPKVDKGFGQHPITTNWWMMNIWHIFLCEKVRVLWAQRWHMWIYLSAPICTKECGTLLWLKTHYSIEEYFVVSGLLKRIPKALYIIYFSYICYEQARSHLFWKYSFFSKEVNFS